MTPLERTTLVSSGLTRPRRCCAGPGERPPVPYRPGAARPRPARRPLTSAAVGPARGGGVLIVLPPWLAPPRFPTRRYRVYLLLSPDRACLAWGPAQRLRHRPRLRRRPLMARRAGSPAR